MLSFRTQPSPADSKVLPHDPSVPTRAQNMLRVNKKSLRAMFAAMQTRTLSRRFVQISPIVRFQRTL
jgi:hypothetical protein